MIYECTFQYTDCDNMNRIKITQEKDGEKIIDFYCSTNVPSTMDCLYFSDVDSVAIKGKTQRSLNKFYISWELINNVPQSKLMKKSK